MSDKQLFWGYTIIGLILFSPAFVFSIYYSYKIYETTKNKNYYIGALVITFITLLMYGINMALLTM
jgi:hypothetical protein